MRILVVEDDENKRSHLVSFLESLLQDAEIRTAASYNSGLRAIIEGESAPETILLDMTLPTFDITALEHGGGSELYGGREILEQMKFRGIEIPVIVITQFDRFGGARDAVTLEELDRQLAREYGGTYRGAVFYNSAREGWQGRLRKLMVALGTGEVR